MTMTAKGLAKLIDEEYRRHRPPTVADADALLRGQTYWGAFDTVADITNIAGELQAGDLAWVTATALPYVCLDPTPGAAIWSPFVDTNWKDRETDKPG